MWDDDDALIARAEELEDLRRNPIEREACDNEDEDDRRRPERFDGMWAGDGF